jgi:hypothetical protein
MPMSPSAVAALTRDRPRTTTVSGTEQREAVSSGAVRADGALAAGVGAAADGWGAGTA